MGGRTRSHEAIRAELDRRGFLVPGQSIEALCNLAQAQSDVRILLQPITTPAAHGGGVLLASGHYVIYYNAASDRVQQLLTICHELAHLLLGHLSPTGPVEQGPLLEQGQKWVRNPAHEREAEIAARLMVQSALGLDPRPGLRLGRRFPSGNHPQRRPSGQQRLWPAAIWLMVAVYIALNSVVMARTGDWGYITAILPYAVVALMWGRAMQELFHPPVSRTQKLLALAFGLWVNRELILFLFPPLATAVSITVLFLVFLSQAYLLRLSRQWLKGLVTFYSLGTGFVLLTQSLGQFFGGTWRVLGGFGELGVHAVILTILLASYFRAFRLTAEPALAVRFLCLTLSALLFFVIFGLGVHGAFFGNRLWQVEVAKHIVSTMATLAAYIAFYPPRWVRVVVSRLSSALQGNTWSGLLRVIVLLDQTVFQQGGSPYVASCRRLAQRLGIAGVRLPVLHAAACAIAWTEQEALGAYSGRVPVYAPPVGQEADAAQDLARYTRLVPEVAELLAWTGALGDPLLGANAHLHSPQAERASHAACPSRQRHLEASILGVVRDFFLRDPLAAGDPWAGDPLLAWKIHLERHTGYLPEVIAAWVELVTHDLMSLQGPATPAAPPQPTAGETVPPWPEAASPA